MTSPTSSPQKPTTGGSPAARSTSGGAGGGGGAGAATQGGGGTAATAGTGAGIVAVGKWQWSESTIPNSGAAGWTRLWRLARLLLQANC